MDKEDRKTINIDEMISLANSTKITESSFGDIILPKYGRAAIKKYTLDNGFMSVEVINYGSTITSIKLPDKEGKYNDIVLGFDDIHGYMSEKNPYFGATVGRVANRISDAFFEYDHTKYFLSKNCGPHMLHGGVSGFDKKVWAAEILKSNGVLMRYTSPDLEEGFPGTLKTNVTYMLTEDNQLIIKFTATTDKTTPVGLTNHAYFNLAGHEAGASGLYEHELKINADKYTELEPEFLTATGNLLPVENTPYDLREFTNVGDAINKTNCEGIDINYCINGEGLRTVARLKHKFSGRSMQVYSNQPGVQLYTSNHVNEIKGKQSVEYNKHSALCLETQNYPNAVNIPKFPKPWLTPMDIYQHIVVFKFNVDNKTEPVEEEVKEKDKEQDQEQEAEVEEEDDDDDEEKIGG